MKPIHPAIAEHVMEENEKLRALLREISEGCSRRDMPSERTLAEWKERIDAALSQQAEPAPAQDGPVIDLDEIAWEAIKQAAAESTWMPPEYMRNEWISDVCSFLRGDDRPAQTEQHPSTTQQVLDLILEQCRYWHGRDEARRGGFACLYAQAKETADNAAPIAQTAPQTAAKMPCGTAVTNVYEAYEAGKRAAAPQPEQSGLEGFLRQVIDELDALNCAYRDIVDECAEPEEEAERCDATDELIDRARAALSAQGTSK